MCDRPYSMGVKVISPPNVGSWTLFAAFDGSISNTAEHYNQGLGTIGDNNFSKSCHLYDSFPGRKIKIRLTMGEYIDYLIPAGEQTLCEMLSDVC